MSGKKIKTRFFDGFRHHSIDRNDNCSGADMMMKGASQRRMEQKGGDYGLDVISSSALTLS